MNKRILTMYVMLALVLASVAAVTHAATVRAVTFTFNTAWYVAKDGVKEYCVVTGPGQTLEYDAPCERVLRQIKSQMDRDYPLIAVDYVIDKRSLNTV